MTNRIDVAESIDPSEGGSAMSDRRLRERDIALTQRLQLSERRIRALRLRAFPGAVRTASADSYVPIDPSTYSPAVQATVTAGRWEAIGHCSISVAPPVVWEAFGLQFGVTDPSSGLDVAGDMTVFDNPQMTATMTDPNAVHTGWVTLFSTCDLVNPLDRVTVSLLVANAGGTGTAFTCVRPRLRLIPV